VALRATFAEVRSAVPGGRPPGPPRGPLSRLVLAVGLVPVCSGFRHLGWYRFSGCRRWPCTGLFGCSAVGLVPVCSDVRRWPCAGLSWFSPWGASARFVLVLAVGLVPGSCGAHRRPVPLLGRFLPFGSVSPVPVLAVSFAH
jgi:hypothetical protein